MSTFNGLYDIVDRHLDITDVGTSAPHYAHKTSALRLSKKPPNKFDSKRMLDEMLNHLVTNWQESSCRRESGPSSKNWRWEKQLDISPNNTSPEKTLEKKIVSISSNDWVNQVPTASGLFDESNDKQRNIDLVHRRNTREYEFIELKVNNPTPLKAAIQVVQYAILYTFARFNYSSVQQQKQELLQAETILLCVLAPLRYYSGYNLHWLVDSLNTGLKPFLDTHHLNLNMNFQFMAFPQDFTWPCSDQECQVALKKRIPFSWN
jgi:hypothetical protein